MTLTIVAEHHLAAVAVYRWPDDVVDVAVAAAAVPESCYPSAAVVVAAVQQMNPQGIADALSVAFAVDASHARLLPIAPS